MSLLLFHFGRDYNHEEKGRPKVGDTDLVFQPDLPLKAKNFLMDFLMDFSVGLADSLLEKV